MTTPLMVVLNIKNIYNLQAIRKEYPAEFVVGFFTVAQNPLKNLVISQEIVTIIIL